MLQSQHSIRSHCFPRSNLSWYFVCHFMQIQEDIKWHIDCGAAK